MPEAMAEATHACCVGLCWQSAVSLLLGSKSQARQRHARVVFGFHQNLQASDLMKLTSRGPPA